MELELAISSNEVLDYQRAYRQQIFRHPEVRRSELAWVTEEVVRALSAVTMRTYAWAISATIKPAVVRGLSSFNLSDKPASFLRKAELAAQRQQKPETAAATLQLPPQS